MNWLDRPFQESPADDDNNHTKITDEDLQDEPDIWTPNPETEEQENTSED